MLSQKLASVYGLVRSTAKKQIHEVALHVDRWRQPQIHPRVVFFRSADTWGGSGFLRARGVGLALRERGWRTVIPSSSLSLSQRQRIIAWERPQVIVLQQSRSPLNRPSLYPGIPCVFDLDDADILDPGSGDIVIECLRESASAIAGSRYIAELMRPYQSNVSVIWTCIDRIPEAPLVPQSERPPVVAWAKLNPSAFSLEAELVQHAMIALAKRRPFTFRLYGIVRQGKNANAAWASGFVAPIRDAGATIELVPIISYSKLLKSLESVAVGLQPVCPEDHRSRGRSFGKILAYLAKDVAVVASDEVDHPLFFRNGQNGLLLDNSPLLWAEGCDRLLGDAAFRQHLATAGRVDLGRRLVATRAAELIEPVLKRAIECKLPTPTRPLDCESSPRA